MKLNNIIILIWINGLSNRPPTTKKKSACGGPISPNTNTHHLIRLNMQFLIALTQSMRCFNNFFSN